MARRPRNRHSGFVPSRCARHPAAQHSEPAHRASSSFRQLIYDAPQLTQIFKVRNPTRERKNGQRNEWRHEKPIMVIIICIKVIWNPQKQRSTARGQRMPIRPMPRRNLFCSVFPCCRAVHIAKPADAAASLKPVNPGYFKPPRQHFSTP